VSARRDLAEIEEATDWAGLVADALAVPPRPSPLYGALQKWSLLFHVVEGGAPVEADYPEAVRFFFQRLALAHYPPELWKWLIDFKRKKGRAVSLAEIPRRYRDLIPTSSRGRPRFDTRRYREARRAWEVLVFGWSYETRHNMISLLRGRPGVTSCFGLNQASMQGDSPSNLAIDLVAKDAKKSVSRLDQMGIRSHKK